MAASDFKPAFRRVQQSGDLDCAFAVVAMIVNTAFEKCAAGLLSGSIPSHSRFRRDAGKQ
ncbi:hypothetical protein [Burkholderia sp. b13]|uniref:hypothetical protein n=1 Tax=Burkholderia sp. b13 TaxID=1761774 RepID=UPI000978B792|nr:hypothetical protein [Burkholderia sp. b13]